VVSTEGAGSNFTLRLPLHSTDAVGVGGGSIPTLARSRRK
jgi:hypothetical protein